MNTLRLSALLAASLTLTNCKLVQAPLNMVGRMIQSGGSLLRMRGDNTRTPDDFKLESSDVKKALADGRKNDGEPDVARSALALR